MPDASHTEYKDASGTPVVTFLECSIEGTALQVDVAAGSRLDAVYSSSPVEEDAECNYGLHPDLFALANHAGMRVCGTDALGECRAVEIPKHPFFVATLFLPQLRSTSRSPHPLFVAFVDAVAGAEGES